MEKYITLTPENDLYRHFQFHGFENNEIIRLFDEIFEFVKFKALNKFDLTYINKTNESTLSIELVGDCIEFNGTYLDHKKNICEWISDYLKVRGIDLENIELKEINPFRDADAAMLYTDYEDLIYCTFIPSPHKYNIHKVKRYNGGGPSSWKLLNKVPVWIDSYDRNSICINPLRNNELCFHSKDKWIEHILSNANPLLLGDFKRKFDV